MRNVFNALVLFFVIPLSVSGQTPAQTVPDFEFFRFDKRPFTNMDLPKSKMLFFVFFDSDCEHCQHAIKYIDKEYKSFKKAAIFLISFDDHEKTNRFIASYGPHIKAQSNVVLLQDKHNQFITKFTPRKYPSMFLFSPEKKLIDYEDNEEAMFRFVNAINKTGK
jgi:peroxiredoxin